MNGNTATWSIRHEGSPRSIEGLTKARIVQGLQDGLWEATDEVRGPDDSAWTALENHAEFADYVLDMEPPATKVYDDETRLDMNPLIDVALVLLIFFILTTSYAAMQKVMDMPGNSAKNVDAPIRKISNAQVKELLVKVEARMKDGRAVIKVEDEEVPVEVLRAALARYAKETRKTNLLIDAQGVDFGTVVAIQDAAKGAGFDMIYFPTPK
jgi:biopolymer transport protein ExbD